MLEEGSHQGRLAANLRQLLGDAVYQLLAGAQRLACSAGAPGVTPHQPGGRYCLTPLYDIISAEPSLEAGQVRARQMKLAMAVGGRNRYRIDRVQARHFLQTAEKVGMPKSLGQCAVDEILANVPHGLMQVVDGLPNEFPEFVPASISRAASQRLEILSTLSSV